MDECIHEYLPVRERCSIEHGMCYCAPVTVFCTCTPCTHGRHGRDAGHYYITLHYLIIYFGGTTLEHKIYVKFMVSKVLYTVVYCTQC